MNSVCVLCMVRNEDSRYIEEFHQHHLDLGAEHIYYLNHIPNDIPIPKLPNSTIWNVGPERTQTLFYLQALQKIDYYWTAIIDVDEFIISQKKLPKLLDDYDYADALGISLLTFGHSNHKVKVYPQKEHYKWRLNLRAACNARIKSIVKTKKVKTEGVNFFGGFTVDENHRVIISTRHPFTGNIIRLNHYFTRSAEDFQIKIERGRLNRTPAMGARPRTWKEFHEFDIQNCIFDEQPTKIHGYTEYKKISL